MKTIDLSKSVYDLTTEYPELIDIMVSLGFIGMKNPMMRETEGRKTTLHDGSAKMGIPMDVIKQTLENNGFTVT